MDDIDDLDQSGSGVRTTVALPALAYQFAGARLDAPLSKVKHWMERNHTALVTGILLVIGAGLVYKGIHALQ